MSDLLYTVFTDITPEYEDEFNTWQEQEHCPLLMTCAGYHSVTRYACMDVPHLFTNFWHIENKGCFDTPERKEKASNTPWGKKLSPERYRHIEFFLQDGGAEMDSPAAEVDEKLTFMVLDAYSSDSDAKNKLTEQYRTASSQIRRLEHVLDVRIYHPYEGLVTPDARLHTAENYVCYYLQCSEKDLNELVLQQLADLTPFAEEKVERLRFQCTSKWKPN